MHRAVKYLIFLGFLGFSAVQADGISRQKAIEMLQGSVAQLTHNETVSCTAAKIGSKQYLTARHCLERLGPDEKTSLRLEHGFNFKFIRSWTVSAEEKEDWVILNVTEEDPEIPMLHLGCGDEVYQGMDIATMGYPFGLSKAYAEGYISTMEEPKTAGLRSASSNSWSVVTIGPGASGSPVISLETGRVVGVVIEQIRGAGYGGMESIKSLDVCEDFEAIKGGDGPVIGKPYEPGDFIPEGPADHT